MTHKKKNRYLMISADCDGCVYLDYVRANSEKAARDIVVQTREDVVESFIRGFSTPELEKIIRGVKTQFVPDTAFDLMRQLWMIDENDQDPDARTLAAAKVGLPGKKLKTQEPMFLQGNWENPGTSRPHTITVPKGAKAKVAGWFESANAFRVDFDLPVEPMFCSYLEIINRFLPAGKKAWNL